MLEQKTVCKFCFNARVDSKINRHYKDPMDAYYDIPLTDDNDGSSCGMGQFNVSDNERYSLMLSSGEGKPVRLEFNVWQNLKNNAHWGTVLEYYPKFCPECGRDLSEDLYK